MIGLSVSGCIADICSGTVRLGDVEKIIARTCCRTPENWDEVIGRYRTFAWTSFPDEAERVIRQLLAANKVQQPRLKRKPTPSTSTVHGNWVTSEDQIVWRSY